MSFAYMPWYTGDYLRDTRHLSPLRHGVYLLALAHCWDSKGPMPLDEQEAAGICNCRSTDEIEALRYVLGRFFVEMVDGHYNRRIQKEIERSESISGSRSEAGKKGYQAKAKQLLSKINASAKQVPLSPSPSPSPSLTPIHDSEPFGSGASTPTDRDLVFANGVVLLTAAGVKESNARSFLAAQCKAHGEFAVKAALDNCAKERPVQPVSWLQAVLGPTDGKKVRKVDAVGRGNYEAAKEFLEKRRG